MSTVLIADDDEAARTLLRTALTVAGYHTFEAADGDQAWRVIQTRPLAAVVTDANLPGRTGLALLRGIRRDPQLRALPVVVSGDDGQRTAAGDEGADAFVRKPLSPASIRAALAEAVAARATPAV